MVSVPGFGLPSSRDSSALVRVAAGAAGAAAAGLVYSTMIERNSFTLRHATLPVLEVGATPLRVLHISDIHMMPNQHLKRAWISELERLEPDLVINTGDNLAHPNAVPAVVQSLGGLLARPGLFVFGSNDYFGPKPKNPLKYFKKDHKRTHGEPLPWQDLRAAFTERGWLDATHTVRELEVGNVRLVAAGVDDPHIERDRYEAIAGRPNPLAQLRLGLTHSPEPRVLDAFADDGYDLVLAGHTHGGQLCVPGYGALVTNCHIDRSRVKGVSNWGSTMKLHVSAGLGTSPYAPARFACRPEASLLTLTPVSHGGDDSREDQSLPQLAGQIG
ncbi:metallophosphoesterase [Gordonia phthalatica]|uniref:Metallophosphoesterase n=1 Tax=Gordonia phthalatica TaxID=1136941 RepID=A0A0N9MN51_9ACTN|nr:metallophosphoesterase [Gordonia phthalatica]ALG83493.1 metallophosphoesterase [Gordonia phthalatica]